MTDDNLKSVEDLKQKIERENRRGDKERFSVLTVSAGTCGQARGSLKVVDALSKIIQAQKLHDRIAVKVTGCHGFCEAEPNILIQPQNLFYQNVQTTDAMSIIEETVLKGQVLDRLLYKEPETGEVRLSGPDIGFYKKQMRLVLGDNEKIDPTKIDDYFAVGGYMALAKALESMMPEEVIDEVIKSGLRGRGGGGFPTGKKWRFTRSAKSDKKYIICNADEGDPGAYMDRSLMEGNPHRVLEGIILGAYAIGADEGYIYIRDEYPVALQHITLAIQKAKELGLLGNNILGTDFSFKIHISRGAGAFVCGEETALMASIMGKVGEPRQRPPFPAVRGLWKKPTNINNVETLANIPHIINRGGDWFAGIGTEGSKGTKIFSLVGKINNTGLVEVPMGLTLREIIYDIGGGIPGDKRFKAVQTGGPSGGCLPKEKLDLPIDYESLTAAGSIMGSGGMIVMDENTCMVDVAKFFLNFLRDESCGKCVSCREGTQRMWEITRDITDGRGTEDNLALLRELAEIAKDASMCGLGQTASNPVLSTMHYFLGEYLDHIRKKKCPAMVCKEIVSAPCQYICPIDQEASVYIALIAQRRFDEAYRVIRKENPLPSVCGRVCDHQCEYVCTANDIGQPIAIRALKRFVMDWAIENGLDDQPAEIAPKNGDKVAVVGSGPGGLGAAYKLSQMGYGVTVFEAFPSAGGMLAVGLPEHRMPKSILKREVDYILKTGVKLETNAALGRDFTIDSLFADGYKAVFLATGAHNSLKMGIPGEDTEGVLQGMKFLTAVNLGKTVKLGKKVGVIGGGNSAMDAARTALRDSRVEEVYILYRRTRQEMPAYEDEIEDALEEGVKIEFLTAPTRVLTEAGRVKGLALQRMELGEPDESGRRRPVPIKGSEYVMELDVVISAIGEQPDTSYVQEGAKLELTPWKTIVADEETGITGCREIFAGGDVVTGPNSVVKAIAAGKHAAETIDKFLQGKSLEKEYTLCRPSRFVELVELMEEEIANAERPEFPKLPVEERRKNFKEVEKTLTEDDAVREARRCLRCEMETEDGKKALEGYK